jgi:plastocyanin
MSRSLLVLLLIAAVIALGIYFLTSGGNDGVQTENDNGETSLGNAVEASDQPAGESVVVSRVELRAPGYVVIHADESGAPSAEPIGNSPVLSAGVSENVDIALTRTSEEGEALYALLYTDNGDGTFSSPTEDVPLRDEEDRTILAKFAITGGASLAEATEVEDDTEGEQDTLVVREFTITGTEFTFSPPIITVSAGEQVRLTFRNTGEDPHNWTVEGLSVGTETIGPGESDTIEFTPETRGRFIVYCSVGNHRAAGMVGTLVVE